jgi:tRNA-dihydrouridine synthase
MGKKRPDLEDEESKKSPRKEKKSFKKAKKDEGKKGKSKKKVLPFDHKYIVAPMVGASELPFRLLCRKYGASLAYTPMMSANQFASSKKYRKEEFSTTPFDKPLVCHFAANKPEDFANAAKEAEPFCDAIDLNLGCPQRTACK